MEWENDLLRTSIDHFAEAVTGIGLPTFTRGYIVCEPSTDWSGVLNSVAVR